MRRLFKPIVMAILVTAALPAQPKQAFQPHENIFAIKQHVDGSPLLIRDTEEFYLFPGAKKVRMPDRYDSCSSIVLRSALSLGVALIRGAVRGGR